jgi:hypothetical protein
MANRLRLEVTAYQRTSQDALVSRPNAPSVGGSLVENLGSVRNRGLEVSVSADVLQQKMVAAGFSATAAFNENKLLRLAPGVLLNSPTREFTRNDVGYPVWSNWGFQITDIDDANGNGIVEPDEIAYSPTSEFIGPNVPQREATFRPYVNLWGSALQLSSLFQYRAGFSRYSYDWLCSGFTGAGCRGENDITAPLLDQARILATNTVGYFGPSFKDASYAVWREVSLSSQLPARLARTARAEAANLVLAGRNVAVLWKASNIPVETSSHSADRNSDGFSGGLGPVTYWLLRLHLTY